MTWQSFSKSLATKLVKYRREGKTVYYSVSDEHVAVILNMGIEHISE